MFDKGLQPYPLEEPRIAHAYMEKMFPGPDGLLCCLTNTNNRPRYLIMEFSKAEEEQLASDEALLDISRRLIEKNREAYEVLAK